MSTEQKALEHLTLAVDFPDRLRVEHWADFAHDVGGISLKFGTTAATGPGMSFEICSEIAAERNLIWYGDYKLNDNVDTLTQTARNISQLDYKPLAVTMFIDSGPAALQAVNRTLATKNIDLIGVTLPTDIDDQLAKLLHRQSRLPKVLELAKFAAQNEVNWITASGKELSSISTNSTTQHLKTFVPGTRSRGAQRHDQKNVITPRKAILYGANVLVIGRQITRSKNPKTAIRRVIEEIGGALEVVERRNEELKV
ncbi:MAG: orotidine 5'-phosphate decarboxylase / HUMPS family protein [Candidatus Saccharimonadales bacterium]